MNIRKSCLLIMLAALLVLCACGNGRLPNDSADTVSSAGSASFAVIKNSAAESLEAFSVMESSAAESMRTPSAESAVSEEPKPQSPDFFALDSLTDPVILLPFHTKEDYPRDFVSAMSNNPIDKIWNHNCYLASLEGDTSVTTHLDIANQAEQLWRKEIEKTISQICFVWDDANQEELKQYAEHSLQVLLDQSSLSGLNWGIRGTLFSLVEFRANVNAYRQVAFQLKYWLYLIETSNGQADASLQFDEESTYDAMPFSAVLCGRVCLIEMPHAPSYVGDDWEAWIESMEKHPPSRIHLPLLGTAFGGAISGGRFTRTAFSFPAAKPSG